MTLKDDQAYGIPGLHEIRPKAEPVAHNYLSIIGKGAVWFVQTNYAWYFAAFGYPVSPV